MWERLLHFLGFLILSGATRRQWAALYRYYCKNKRIMERKISLADVRKAVDYAYEKYKDCKDGALNPRVTGADPDAFGISVALTDGTIVNKGDTSVASPMGSIAKLAIHSVLLSQNTLDELVQKYMCGCSRGSCARPQVGISARGVRAVSAVVPQNDPDGKMDILSEAVTALMGSEPRLDDRLYESLRKMEAEENAVNAFAAADFQLYDSTDTSLDIYTRLMSLGATAEQLATMGATVAADGRNPKTGESAFDGSTAQSLVTLVALSGPHHEKRAFAMKVGLPVKRGYAGTLLAILPGFGAIAVYAPLLDDNGVSVKGRKALEYIAATLGLNIYASARVSVEQ